MRVILIALLLNGCASMMTPVSLKRCVQETSEETFCEMIGDFGTSYRSYDDCRKLSDSLNVKFRKDDVLFFCQYSF